MLCKSFKENKKVYFENINFEDIDNNKNFWKTSHSLVTKV